MATDHRVALAKIKRFDQLIAFLRDAMDWPIEGADFDDLTFEYSPEELGIDARNAVKIEQIKRLRPLSANQPWGVFFVKFAPKRLPVVALRRILSQVALKKRSSANPTDRAAWAADDLLFISNYGEGEERQITFAHFSQPEGREDLPTLKVLGWDNRDTLLHLDEVAEKLTHDLAWPRDDRNALAWRDQWRGAFTLGHREAINTAKELSIRLAELARAVRDRITHALAVESDAGPLTRLMKAFREALVHALDAEGFADMYAQTIAYGLLSARIAAPGAKASDHLPPEIPVTNPFLKEMMETFLHAGTRRGKAGRPGIDFDELGVGEVVELLDRANMEAVVKDFGDRNPQEDPVIHFYEHFLEAYDKEQKVSRGVFYTPRPVVSYIVRAVDELLRAEFALEDGLADTTSWSELVQRRRDIRIPEGISPKQAFVQILDPATGTGTFLVEVIEVIHTTLVAKWRAQGNSTQQAVALWNDYVPKSLLPRLHAYELLMAPYAIAHLKVGLKLHETGYLFGSPTRARIYLTNSLEPGDSPGSQTELTDLVPALAHEAEAVNEVKRQKRFTVILGNPPYAKHSSNHGEWIAGLLRGWDSRTESKTLSYYEVDGAPLGERNPKWLSDDYVKFMRFCQWAIDQSGHGIWALITNHGYLDNPTFRGLRQALLTEYSQVYVLDLHGNTKKGEIGSSGEPDENVFAIQQGVAIGVFVKAAVGASAPQCSLHYADLYGTQAEKYEWLSERGLLGGHWTALSPLPSLYLFRVQDAARAPEYAKGWPVQEVFPINAVGFQTHRDYFVLDISRDDLLERIRDFADPSQTDDVMRRKYFSAMPPSRYPRGDTRDWRLNESRRALASETSLERWITRCIRRPFDFQWYFHHPAAIDYGRPQIMDSLIHHENLAMLWTRPMSPNYEFSIFATRVAADQSVVGNKSAGAGGTYVAPLYCYPSSQAILPTRGGWNTSESAKHVNIAREFLDTITGALALRYSPDRQGRSEGVFCAADVFNYTYAVFHAPSYRARYADFLRRDFPRVPIPGTSALFYRLAHLGSELAALHLMDADKCRQVITEYVGPKNPEVGRVDWSDETVWLDAPTTKKHQPSLPGTIGFRGVPQAVWNFQIGGYQVCWRWLKERKGRTLSKDDIAHFQRTVAALSETIRLMKEVDEAIEEHGGWPGAFAMGSTVEPGRAEGVQEEPRLFDYDTTPPPLRKVAESNTPDSGKPKRHK